MKMLEAGKFGRTIIVELTRGDRVIECIDKALKEAGVTSAVIVSCVGSLQKLHYHWPTDTGEVANDEFLTIEGAIEVGSLTGTYIGGAAHYHIVASDLEKKYVGHLEPDTEVLYLLEIVFAELEGCNLERKLTPQNVKLLFPK